VTGPATGRPVPHFIGIGAGKAGTTWVWSMLRQHPDVFLPKEKELHYFNEEGFGPPGTPNPRSTRPLEWYLDHFAGARPGQACGEISPTYLWNDTAPARIHAVNPDVRLFAVLRDPVQRVFSSYLFSIQRGEIPNVPFERALRDHGYMADRTEYSRFIRRYLEQFSRDQLLVLLHDDLRADGPAALRRLEGHLGVSDFVPTDVGAEENATARPAFPVLTRTLMRGRMQLRRRGFDRLADVGGVGRLFSVVRRQVKPYDERPTIPPEVAARLYERFLPDIERLESMLDLDLSAWKSVATHPGNPSVPNS